MKPIPFVPRSIRVLFLNDKTRADSPLMLLIKRKQGVTGKGVKLKGGESEGVCEHIGPIVAGSDSVRRPRCLCDCALNRLGGI